MCIKFSMSNVINGTNKLQYTCYICIKFSMVTSKIRDAATPNMFLGNTEIIKNEVKEHTPIETSSIAESSATEKRVPANVLSKSRPESESRIQMLEEELKEAPAIEVALYSVVAKHGSLMNKVPTPARRLARFYLHAWRTKSPAKQARLSNSSAPKQFHRVVVPFQVTTKVANVTSPRRATEQFPNCPIPVKDRDPGKSRQGQKSGSSSRIFSRTLELIKVDFLTRSELSLGGVFITKFRCSVSAATVIFEYLHLHSYSWRVSWGSVPMAPQSFVVEALSD
ncbi:hypothetical protein FXO38_06743 [Capsicum annuum]|nr:hypothetical protein FXO38_06743 [Capsicum annuum]KAF3673351.1 hypothetical protein FXO37_07049 [Capsicum annuum]